MATMLQTEFRFYVAIFEILGRDETAALIARLDRHTLSPSSSALTIARMGPRAVEVLSPPVLLCLAARVSATDLTVFVLSTSLRHLSKACTELKCPLSI
uniref:Uncharacterized protein n=1 Tax=Plectus sambesii TaxID=2011161 RepID=A0A914UXI4_9BILA